MLDCIIAWILLIIGIGTQDAEWFIASGLFSISSYLSYYWRKNIDKENNNGN